MQKPRLDRGFCIPGSLTGRCPCPISLLLAGQPLKAEKTCHQKEGMTRAPPEPLNASIDVDRVGSYLIDLTVRFAGFVRGRQSCQRPLQPGQRTVALAVRH